MAVHHLPYVAGRYRDGLRSDHWTDVRRCAEATFVAYSAGCTCGWAGPDWKADDWGHRRSLRDGQKHRIEHESASAEPAASALLLTARLEVDGDRAVG